MNYLCWNIMLMVHIYASDKHVGAGISQNNKPIDLSQEK